MRDGSSAVLSACKGTQAGSDDAPGTTMRCALSVMYTSSGLVQLLAGTARKGSSQADKSRADWPGCRSPGVGWWRRAVQDGHGTRQ